MIGQLFFFGTIPPLACGVELGKIGQGAGWSWGWTGLGRRSNGRDAGRGPVQQLAIVEFEGDDGQFEIPAATFALSFVLSAGGV